MCTCAPRECTCMCAHVHMCSLLYVTYSSTMWPHRVLPGYTPLFICPSILSHEWPEISYVSVNAVHHDNENCELACRVPAPPGGPSTDCINSSLPLDPMDMGSPPHPVNIPGVYRVPLGALSNTLTHARCSTAMPCLT